MAKEDFCFTYYDGDAARDTTHMNRLERGAYHDLILSQRKFGHLTLEQIKKILGRDFDECWPANELVLKTDADGKYYIEWVENSILKMRAHSKKQSENRKNSTKDKPNSNQQETKQQPKPNQTQPLEDGYGNENGFGKGKEKKGVQGETEIDFTKPDINGDDIVFPLDTAPFRELWAHWKKYRWEVHSARYGMMGEQADLKRLEQMDFLRAQQTILTAIAGKWKNLYPEANGKAKNGTNNHNKKREQSEQTAAYVTDYYKTKLSESEAKRNV